MVSWKESEAVRAFLPAMAGRLGIGEVYGVRLHENKASGRVMEKCGFQVLSQGKDRITRECLPLKRACGKRKSM